MKKTLEQKTRKNNNKNKKILKADKKESIKIKKN